MSATGALALGMVMLGGWLAMSAPVIAQSALGRPDAEAPRLPDGFAVSPVRPVPQPLEPGTGQGLPGGASGADPEASPRQRPFGGCRYDEQKLELLV